jgi:glycosidase
MRFLLSAIIFIGLVAVLPASTDPIIPDPASGESRDTSFDWASVPASDPLILQWFESGWFTMSRRMGDVFRAGYSAIWVPPPGRGSGSGDFIGQIGYDLYDRYDFGQKSGAGTPTRYGDTRQMNEFLARARRANMVTIYDSVMNHNGSGTHSNQNFVNSGGYPGFAMSFGGDPWGDFHPPGGGDDLTMYLAGLIDIDQSKNHTFIRQPAEPGPNNVPGAGSLPNQPIRQNHRRFYPDLNPAPGDVLTPSGFNLTNPLGGDPVPENATGYLLRYTAYMNEVIGWDGIRIDAVKHIPTWYFNNLWDAVIENRGRRLLDGTATTPFSFGEAFDGSINLLMSYHNRGPGRNRTVLDFAHYFTINDIFNAGGSADLSNAIRNTIDYADDANGFNGSAGVFFLASHDKPGGGGSNIGNFWVALRKGYGIIYHNAGEFPPVRVNGQVIDFPRAGGSRGDALGAFPPDNLGKLSLIADIADIRRRYAHGNWVERWLDPDYIALEYQGRLIYGLSDRSSSGVITINVQTAFPAGTQLIELTGNARRYNQRTNTNDVPLEASVGQGGTFQLKIPHNSHQFGYVAYGPRTPSLQWTLSNVVETIPPDPESVPVATRRLTPVRRITADSSLLTVTSDGTERTVMVRVGNRDLNGNGAPDILRGGLAGCEFMTKGANNTYTLNFDWASLGDGYHYVEIIAPVGGGAGQHGMVWTSERFTVLVDRIRPTGVITTPGTTTVTSTRNVDVRIVTDGTEDNALINIAARFVQDRPVQEFQQMTCPGPLEWTSTVEATPTNRVVTIRLYEESGSFADIVYTIPGDNEPPPPFVVDGVQSGSEAYLVASNAGPGVDTNTRFGFGDSAKVERLASFQTNEYTLIFAEGSLHSANKLFVLVDIDADGATGWRDQHPVGTFSEAGALRYFSDVFDGGYELVISIGSTAENPPTSLFVTILAYDAAGALVTESYLGTVPIAGGALPGVIQGRTGSIQVAYTPGDGANNGIEIALPRSWFTATPGSWRLGALNGNGANNFWSNSTIPQNSLTENIGLAPANAGALADLVAPVFGDSLPESPKAMLRTY